MSLDDLDSLTTLPADGTEALPSTPARREGRWEPQTLKYSYEALIDQILANPAATNIELGKVFGRTPQWVAAVRSSSLFRENFIARAGSMVDPVLAASVEQRLEMVTQRSLEVLMHKLERPIEQIPDGLAIEAAKLGAKGLGVGGFSTRPVAPPIPPSADRLARLAERLVGLGKTGAQDVPFVEVVSPASPA